MSCYTCDVEGDLDASPDRERVWVGEHWAMAKEGFGPGRFHDIRFVEPTVSDRRAVLDFVDSILK